MFIDTGYINIMQNNTTNKPIVMGVINSGIKKSKG